MVELDTGKWLVGLKLKHLHQMLAELIVHRFTSMANVSCLDGTRCSFSHYDRIMWCAV